MGRSQRVFKKRKNSWKCSGNKLERPKSVSSHCESDRPRPSVETKAPSASRSKLGNFSLEYNQFEDNKFTYDIVDLEGLMKSIYSVAVCKDCGNELTCRTVLRVGLATKLQIECSRPSCLKTTFLTSPKVELCHEGKQVKDLYDINLRLVYGLRTIGKGQTSGDVLCAILNLPSPPTRFQRYVDFLTPAVKEVALNTMKEAVQEAVDQNEGVNEIAIGLDGTWQKRGFVSLNGVITATSVDVGKVIDIEIFSKYCDCKQKLEKIHEANCKANYLGTSGGMEVQGARTIFSRSLPQYNVKYLKYLGDGDSKGFETVSKEAIYGTSTIEKLECLGHVQKRMGTRLRNLKSKTGKQSCQMTKLFLGVAV